MALEKLMSFLGFLFMVAVVVVACCCCGCRRRVKREWVSGFDDTRARV